MNRRLFESDSRTTFLDSKESIKRFETEVWIHADVVARVARVLTRDWNEAEDLSQEALLKAFRFIDQLKPGSDAKKWLLVILRNTWTDRVRSMASRKSQVSLESVEEGLADDRLPEKNESRDPREILDGFSDPQILGALSQLPDEMRWVLLLVDVEALDHMTAAEVLDVAEGTIKSRAHRGRAMLRRLLLPLAQDRRLVTDTEKP